MSATEKKSLEQVFEEYSEAWAALDPDRIVEFHAEDGAFCLHVGEGTDAVGHEAIREAFAGVIAQFPDFGSRQVRLSFGEDHCVCEWKFSGQGMEWDGVDVFAFRDGLITRKDTYVDSMGLQARLAGAGEGEAD
jgi:ketosteroid isomerase-like protein